MSSSSSESSEEEIMVVEKRKREFREETDEENIDIKRKKMKSKLYQRNKLTFKLSRWNKWKKNSANSCFTLCQIEKDKDGFISNAKWYCSICSFSKEPKPQHNFSSSFMKTHLASEGHKKACAVKGQRSILDSFSRQPPPPTTQSLSIVDDQNERGKNLIAKIAKLQAVSIVAISNLIKDAMFVILENLSFTKFDEFSKLNMLLNKGTVSLGKYCSSFGFLKILHLLFLLYSGKVTRKLVESADFFSVSFDGSTDIRVTKKLLVLLSFLVRGSSGFEKKNVFLDLCVLDEGSTAEIQKLTLLKVFQENNIPLEKISCIATDGENTNHGIKGGVIVKLQEDLKDAIGMKCIAHTADLAFKGISNFEIIEKLETILCEIYTFFKYPKRKRLLVAAADKCMTELKSFKRFNTTRWLSRGAAIESICIGFVPLIVSFESIISNQENSTFIEDIKRFKHHFTDFVNVMILFLMRDICKKQVTLSQCLQKRGISFRDIFLQIVCCIQGLESIKLELEQDEAGNATGILLIKDSELQKFYRTHINLENEKLFFLYQTKNREGVLRDAYTSLRFKGSTNFNWRDAFRYVVKLANEILDSVITHLHDRFDSILEDGK